MKINLLFQLPACIVTVMFLLLPLQASVTSCDEACSADAPTCECVCACYGGKDTAAPAGDVLPAMNVVQYTVQFESSQSSLLLATDIFRPPIA